MGQYWIPTGARPANGWCSSPSKARLCAFSPALYRCVSTSRLDDRADAQSSSDVGGTPRYATESLPVVQDQTGAGQMDAERYERDIRVKERSAGPHERDMCIHY